MELFLQAVAVVLLVSVLSLALGKLGKDMAVVLVIGVCCMVMGLAAAYLTPVLDFLKGLEALGNLGSDLVSILLKAAGIGLLTEIAAMICSDAGNASLGKALQILGNMVILFLTIPIFTALMDLIVKILEGA